MWLAIHDGVVTLRVSLYKKMTEAGTQIAEPVVMSHPPPRKFSVSASESRPPGQFFV